MGVVNHSHKVGETLPPHLIRFIYIVIHLFGYMGYYMYLCIVKKGDTQHEQLQTRIIRRTHQTNHQKEDDTEIRTIKKGVQQKEEERPIIIFW